MSTNSIMEVIITTSADAANMNDLQEGQLVQLTDRDNAFYRATSSANGNYYNAYSVLKTGNAAINLNIQAGGKVTPGMLGFNNPPNQKQTQARHNYLAMYHTFKVCAGKSATVVMPDSDFEMEIDRAIIVPANTTVQWGKGILTPVLSEGMQYYPDETVSRDTSGVAIGYGAIFATGDSQNGRIFSARNQIEMGTVHWIDVKISNIRRTDQGESYSVRSDDKGYLHGILACGGINIFERCHIEGMPDSGIRCDMFEEAHYINTDCSNNGHATRSTDAWAANGIANTGTQAYLDLDDALDTRYATRLLVIEGGRYCGNAKAGIMAAGIPMTRISQVDCTDNGFTAYYGPGESNYKRTAPLKDADGNTVIEQLEITHSYLTGTPGKTVHSIYLRDGYAKQLKLGGNVLGDVTGSAVHADCSELGSIEFTLRNRINFLNDMLQEGCHGIYVNAGQVKLEPGLTVRGEHDRSGKNASLLIINNDMPEIGAEVSVADIHSGVKFKTVISGYISKKFTARSIHCFSKNSAVIVTNRADETDITVDNFTGGFNSAGQDDQALLRISGLQYCSVKSLVLADNISRPVSNTQCPVFIEGSADVTGQIKRLSSSANYLRDYLSSDIAKPMSAFTEVSRNDVV